ncbi:MAG: aldehyde dehydrogenase family protein [Caldisericia bacterium]
MRIDFINEPYLNMKNPDERAAMQEAIDFVQANLGHHYNLFIGGKEVETEGKITSVNPSKKDEVIGTCSMATRELAEQAMQTAHETFKTWSKVPARERASYLYRAAGIMRRRKLELSAWMVFEEGKNWIEAIADTAEAIDFLEYYGRVMEAMDGPIDIPAIPGEENNYWLIPLGVGVVIPPWNFPLAILAGMTTAAVVTGNTVVLKPASISTVIAAKFMEVMHEAGIPDGVINFIPGSGSEIGDYIVDHKYTRFISFTGSMEVGIRINERAAKVNEGQIWLKRVVAEMGGKDTQIVDANYHDLDFVAELDNRSSIRIPGTEMLSMLKTHRCW